MDKLTVYFYINSNENMVISEPIWQAKRDHGDRWLLGQIYFNGQNATIQNIIFEASVGNTYRG